MVTWFNLGKYELRIKNLIRTWSSHNGWFCDGYMIYLFVALNINWGWWWEEGDGNNLGKY